MNDDAKQSDRKVSGEKDELRERILDAGYRMLFKFGENKTSMADIAEAAEVSRGTVYRYFGDREQLLDAIWAHTNKIYWDTIDARITSEMSLGEMIETRAHELIRATRGLPDHLSSGSVQIYRKMMSADIAGGASLSIQRTVPLLKTARARGELREDLDIELAADWITRSMLSLIWLPNSAVVDLTDENEAARYAREFIMYGIGSKKAD